MTTELVLASKLDILKETRELFANTHWTSGALYETDHTGKKRFCMVGGLCHVTAKNNLPEWLAEQESKVDSDIYGARVSFYMQDRDDDKLLRELDDERFIDGLDAEWELAKTILAHQGGELPRDASPGRVEDIIVSWNDGIADDEFQARGDASYVLEVMDETIKRVEAELA